MDQLDIAIHNSVHKGPETAREIAKKLGMSHQVLLNKCNPHNNTHHLRLTEARAIMLQTGCFEILDVLLLDREERLEKADLDTAMMDIVVELGEVYKAIQDAKEDQRVTGQEKSKIYREIEDVAKLINQIKKAVSLL